MEKKEAMKILKDFHDKSALFSVRTALDTIIPELKESEDERIRKMIIYQMERWHKAALENNAVQDIKDSADAITWLEKQGEKKPNYCHHEVDLSDCSEEYRKAYYDGWNNCNQQHEQLKAEQKPAWSEEDDAMFQGVIETEQYMLDVVYGRKTFDVGNVSIKEECTKELAWLKSLRPQKQWKSAWSEKDEKLLKLSLENLTELKNRFDGEYGKVGDCINWLKSLKDRIK